jgi:small ligand-binding sensory domain FIST
VTAPPTAPAASATLLSTFDEDALIATVQKCRSLLARPPQIAFVFASADWRPHLEPLLEIIQVYGHGPTVVGCSAEGFIGTGQEDEEVSGASFLFLDLPAAEFTVARIDNGDLAEAERGGGAYWHEATGLGAAEARGWVALANPAAFDGERWLRSWNAAFPGVPTFGGLASGGRNASEFFLFHDRDPEPADALAIGVSGGVRLAGVVSQGCRPIGQPYTITSATDNVVFSIASKRAYEVLEAAFESLGADDRRAALGNIFAGLATSEYVEDFKPGDFLVRNIIGGDPDAGAIALGAYPRVGQTLQFQLRDRASADEDLRDRMHSFKASVPKPLAALLFSCAGRGARFFGFPNHDAGIVEDVFGPMPLAGFFCNGEFGPVGPSNHLHGYTASSAFFVPC